MKKSKSKILIIVTLMIVAISTPALLCGCSVLQGCFGGLFGGSFRFTKSAINVGLNEQYRLQEIIETDIDADGYTVKSSDDDIVSVVGNATLLPKAVGEATLSVEFSVRTTSESEGASLLVVVGENGLKIVSDSYLVQTSVNGAFYPVTLGVEATGAVIDGNINWSVDGGSVQRLSASQKFDYTPKRAGSYEVKAAYSLDSTIFDTVTIRAYDPILSASGAHSGNLVRHATDPAIVLTVTVNNYGEDLPYIQWLDNDTPIYEGTDTVFAYFPDAGEHKVQLYVNGVLRKIDGLDEITVKCEGAAAAPKNVEVVFDNAYPHLYITADVVGDMQVEITNPSNYVLTYNKKTNPELFGANGFDAASIITLCGGSDSAYLLKSYKIRVKSLGDGGYITEGDYSAYTTFKQLPSSAKKYLEDIYTDKDHYLTSDSEYIDMFEYYVVTRGKTPGADISFDAYVGYSMKYSPQQLWNYAFRIGATSGTYEGKGAYLDYRNSKILRTQMATNTVNKPTTETYSPQARGYASQLHAVLPHINYDESKYRADDYVFPIDKLDRTESVSYTDDLYIVAQNGAQPLPTTGSAAETVYNMARNILRQIVTDDMTDKQKAHAIYDWILWQVTYDTPATNINVNSEKYSAYYLEGVFGDGKTPIGGKIYYPYAVCDGMSKAYSLMCNIEGIPCVRVSGYGGSDGSFGGHAWNKVQIDGQWYIVDCTWGDTSSDATVFNARATYELGRHDWLFVTDGYADSTHYEPYRYGVLNKIIVGGSEIEECPIRYAPATARQKLSPYTDMVYNGVTINCEVKDDENQSTRVKEIASQFAAAYKKVTSVKVPGGVNETYSVPYQALEIYFDNGVSSQSTLNTLIKAELLKKGIADRNCQILWSSNIALVCVK